MSVSLASVSFTSEPNGTGSAAGERQIEANRLEQLLVRYNEGLRGQRADTAKLGALRAQIVHMADTLGRAVRLPTPTEIGFGSASDGSGSGGTTGILDVCA